MSNKKLRGKADVKAEMYTRETAREIRDIPRGGWLDFEVAEKIRTEIDAWPDWKKEMFDVDGSRARARSAAYIDSTMEVW